MNRATSRLFTLVNSAFGRFALLLFVACVPLRVAHAQMAEFSGNNQSGLTGSTLQNPLTVRFSGSGNFSLLWTVDSGSATIQESGGTTFQQLDGSTVTARGQTESVHLVLGSAPGTVTVHAHCGGCDTGIDVFFTETVNGPNGLSSPSGSGQSGQIGTTLPSPLSVTFTGASNATLQWRVTSGVATFQESGSTTYTALNGTAQTAAGQTSSVHLVLGNTAGPIGITATCTAGCNGTTTQNFTATATPPPTNNMSLASGNNQSGTASSTLVNPLVVSFSGAPVGRPDVQLDWQVVSGIATIQESGSGSYTQNFVSAPGSTAQVHLQLGSSPGSVTVSATCSSGCSVISGSNQSVTFTETITAASAPLTLSVYSGDTQTGTPGSTLPTALDVLITPSNGFDSPPIPVSWHIESGDATIVESHGTSYTDTVTISGGQPANSHVSIALGPTPSSIVVSATCTQCTPQTRQFHLTSAASTTAQLTKVSGDNQSGIVGSASDLPLVVQLGVPGSTALSGAPINWSVISGQATLSASTTQTDTNGLSQITFNYSGTPGAVIIEASSTAGKIDFNATAVLANTGIAGGNNQVAAIGTTLAPFVVQVNSSTGAAKGLSAVPVQWKITSGLGTLASGTTLTNASGQASNTLTLGNSAGVTTVTATIPGTGSVTSTFTARAIAQASIAPVSGDNQSGPSGAVLQPFVLQVVTGGQAAPGVTVDWTVLQGGGTLASTTSISDASGHASNTLTLGSATGPNVVRASIGGLGSISFTAFASTVAGGNSQFQIVSGDAQSLTPGVASNPLVVKLLSASGQPVSGAVVQWAVNGQTGTLKAPTTQTDSSGQTQNTLTVILPGSYTVTAQVAGATSLPTLTFHLGNGVSNLPGITPGQSGPAGVIDKACPALAALPPAQLTPAQKDLLNRCTEIVLAAGTHPGQVPGALGQLTNNRELPQRQLANGVQVSQFGNLNTRLAELRQGVGGFSTGGLSLVNGEHTLPLAMLGDVFRKDPKDKGDEVGKDFERWGFFATGMVERGGFDAQGNRPGFDFHNDSLTAGVDYRFNADFVAGVALGYNRNDSSLALDGGSLNADSFSVSGYFTWYHNNDFYVEGSLGMDWLSYDLSRNIAYQIADATNTSTTSVNQTLTASPDGHQTSLSLSLGKDFARGAWSVSPYVRGVYSHLSLSAFSETARDPNAPGSGLATSIESRSLTSALLIGGARVSYTTSFDWGVLVPNATVEWNHELKNDPQTIVARFLADPTQTPMTITDQAPDSNYFNLGLGLNAVLPKGRSAFLLWEHLAGYSGAHENRYSIGVRIEF